MKEHEARKALLKRQDLTDGDKVVMMAILMTMDWGSWTNRTSFKAIANLTGKRRCNIARNIKKIEKLGYIKRDFMSAESCKAPVMTIIEERLASPQNDNKGVIEKITGGYPNDNRGVINEITGGVINGITDGVISEITLSTTNNINSYKNSHIKDAWGVPDEELWGDALRKEANEESD